MASRCESREKPKSCRVRRPKLQGRGMRKAWGGFLEVRVPIDVPCSRMPWRVTAWGESSGGCRDSTDPWLVGAASVLTQFCCEVRVFPSRDASPSRYPVGCYCGSSVTR